MPHLLKVAIVQEKRTTDNCKANTLRGLNIVNRAKSQGADIVLFPECFITGYEFPVICGSLSFEELIKLPEYKTWCDNALADNSQYIQEFCRASKKLNIGIVITAFTKGKNRPQSSAFVIDKSGEIILKYSKVHTCDFAEERMLQCGNEFKVCNFCGVQIGIMICYDREYPESARVLMLKGAELILVPSDCCAMPPRVRALSTRAYENMVGVAMANPAGKNAGYSCAFSPIVWDNNGCPEDNTLVLADDLTEDIFIAAFNMEKLRNYRKSEMMGNTFRRVKTYTELLNNEIHEPFIRIK